MVQRQREPISGIYPKFPCVKTDQLVSLDEILQVIGHTLDKFDCKKTFSIATPRCMGREEALQQLKKGRFEVKDLGRKIEIRIFGE